MKKIIYIIPVAIVIVLLVGIFIPQLKRTRNIEDGDTPQPTATSIPTSVPTTTTPTEMVKEAPDVPEGWLTYTNEQYGFEISYPANYQALNDEENLYGWSNAIVLIYGGGQSYDLPIEVWNSEEEYEDKYTIPLDDLTVKQIGNKYITLLNMNRKAEVNEIIATFTILE